MDKQERVQPSSDIEPTAPHEGPNETEDTAKTAAPKEELKSGEKAFAILLFLAGAFFFWQALELWLRMSPPRASSAAALPLFTTGIWTILSFVGVVETLRKTSPLSRYKSVAQKLKHGIAYVLPKEVAVIIGVILLYSVLVFFRFNFYVISSLFLYGSMCYFTRKWYLLNILWTALFMAFIYVVFQVFFNVVFF